MQRPHQLDGFARTTNGIAQALRSRKDVAVLLVWLQGVERMCASAGHLATSKLIEEFHVALQGICRNDDSVERLGDRKFSVLLVGLKNQGHVTLAARKIEQMARGFSPDSGPDMNLKTTIGVALGPGQGNEPHDLLRMAEVARLDGHRKNYPLCFFEEDAASELFQEWDLESKLRDALDSGDIELYFQPKTLIESGEVVGAEALSRWHHPELGQVSPELFIELAESTGQIFELTQYAIQTSCRMLSEWQEVLPDIEMSINISPSLVSNSDVVEMLKSATSIWDVSPARLTLEVTETALMDDREASHRVLTAIREFGSKVSIDDFGTGYSSLAYLKEIPADELKIDRTFVMNMLDDSRDHKIVEHALGIAESFDLSVVAEGIETAEALSELARLNCKYAQGYYISRPLPADEFLEFCRNYGR